MTTGGTPGRKRSMIRSTSTKRSLSKTSRKRKASTALGRLGGAQIGPSRTTMANAVGPFANYKTTTFLYENALAKINPGTTFWALSVVANGMFDFDASNFFGNKQPLYFDQLISATGPYKNYKVISWKTTYTFINEGTTPVNIWVAPALALASEVDLASEADNFPGVKKLYLTSPSGSENKGTLTVTGHINDVYKGFVDDVNFLGSSTANPTTSIYESICAQAADGVANAIVYVAVKHEAFTELLTVDALVS